MEVCCFWSWFLRPSLVWLRITLIYCRDAWRLRLEDQRGSSHVRKTAWNYGRGGAAIMIWGGWEHMAAEELEIKRGGKFWRQIFGSCIGESLLGRKTKADCARGFPNCVDRGVDLFCRRKIGLVTDFFHYASSQPNLLRLASGIIAWRSAQVGPETRERLKVFAQELGSMRECWKDGTQLFASLRFLYIFTPSMFAVHQFSDQEECC
jgi:hypothetical protein